MKAFTGFLIILFSFVFFIFVLIQTNSEWRTAEALPTFLDEKIPIKEITLMQTSYMTDSQGNVFSELLKGEDRTILPANEIPQIVRDIFITMEDKHFYEHIGFDIAGIGRAALVNLQNDSIEQGGSTVTQQLARNLFLTNEKTYNRKLSELLYSYQLERKLTKEEILTLYMNTIYFQNGVYGIEAASRFYFNQSAKDSSLAKLAFLCAIPNNPSLYDPLTHFENTKKRQERILQSLLEAGLITAQDHLAALNEPLSLSIRKRVDSYPDYTTYILHEFVELVGSQDGYYKKISQTTSEKEKKELQKKLDHKITNLLSSGINVETALNPSIQEKAVQAVEHRLPFQDIQGAVAVIDHTSNQLVAIVGGRNYHKYDFHRGFQAYRQPGSAIKPLLVYAPYFDQTGAPVTQSISANNLCISGYCPKNYGGGQYGTVNLKTAFQYSYNTPAVILLDRLGVATAFSYLQKLHFSHVVSEDLSLPAAIGGFKYGMSPLELTNAFTTFSNDGQYIQAHGIVRVTDFEGNVLYQWEEQPIPVWNKETNNKMRSLLQEVVTNGTAKKAYFPSDYIGGKTGTTNDVKDLWFIGMTNRYTAGVWVGNDQSKSIQRVEALKPQLLIWKDIMQASR